MKNHCRIGNLKWGSIYRNSRKQGFGHFNDQLIWNSGIFRNHSLDNCFLYSHYNWDGSLCSVSISRNHGWLGSFSGQTCVNQSRWISAFIQLGDGGISRSRSNSGRNWNWNNCCSVSSNSGILTVRYSSLDSDSSVIRTKSRFAFGARFSKNDCLTAVVLSRLRVIGDNSNVRFGTVAVLLSITVLLEVTLVMIVSTHLVHTTAVSVEVGQTV